jgi:hypothetical protein
VIDRADETFLRCTQDGSEVERWLEIPAWMFDRAACPADVRLSALPFVSLGTLSALSGLIDQVMKSAAESLNAGLLGACRTSRDQTRGEAHGTEDGGVSDRGSAQATTCGLATGSVQGNGREGRRRSGLAGPAGGSTEDAGRLDDAADAVACTGGRSHGDQ